MPAKNQFLSGLCYVAWDTSANLGKTGDSSNHTLRLVRDGVETVPEKHPVEVDPTNCPGLYKLDLTASEMNCQILTLAGTSSTSNISIIPVQLTTSVVASIASGFSSSSPQIWTDAQLTQWSQAAIGQIAVDVKCIWARECASIQAGQSVYKLPSYVRTLSRITWRGRSLEPLNWEDFTLLSPGTAFISQGNSLNVEYTQSRPLYYTMHPSNAYDVRLYPCPNETFTTTGEANPYAPTPNSPSCIISYWREPDTNGIYPTISLPTYIARRTIKAYVLWQAYGAEGKGLDLKASQYWKGRYQFLIEKFRSINEGCFVSKRYALGEETGSLIQGRWPKPTLGPNFERVRF